MSWEQISNTIRFIGFFTEDGIGATGVAPTFSAYNPSKSLIVNNQAATEIGLGFYHYDVDSGDTSAVGEYIGIFMASGTNLDQRHLPALWIVGRGGVEYIDASITSVPNLSRDALIAASGSLNVKSVIDNVNANVVQWRASEPLTLSNGNVQSVVTGIVQATVNGTVDANITQVDGTSINPIVPGFLPVDTIYNSGQPLEAYDGIVMAATSSTVTLQEVATDDLLNGTVIQLRDGQTRYVTDYVGSTRTATLNEAWARVPESGTPYFFVGMGIHANLSVNVSGVNGKSLSDPVNGNLNATIGISGINRNTFALVDELSAVPTFPANPLDMVTLLYEREAHKTLTTSGNYTIYKANATDTLGSATLNDYGNSFVKDELS